MSLDDLAIRAQTDKLQKELDAQKEKAAKWKKFALNWKRKAIEYAFEINKARETISSIAMASKDNTRESLLQMSKHLQSLTKDDIVEVRNLQRGDIVVAAKDLLYMDPAVKKGTKGVVFHPANTHEENTGPMVRWLTGQRCNVYDGDVMSEDFGNT